MRIIAAALVGCLLVLPAGAADDYPNRPVTFVVPFAPGGSTSIIARILSQKLEQRLGKPFVVENRPGSGGMIAVSQVAHGVADGYTIMMASSTALAINVNVRKQLPYDPRKDITPVALIARMPYVLVVNPDLPVKSVGELIAHAKANPGQLSFSSAGSGTDTHLAGELFKSMTGTTMVHVPYRGGAPALVDLLAGRVQLAFASVATTISAIQAGKLRALAMTGKNHFEGLPGVPTIAESGVPGYEINNWYGIFAPANTPQTVIQRLNTETIKILQKPDVRAKLIAAGLEPMWSTPTEFADYVRAETAKWRKIVVDSGATAN